MMLLSKFQCDSSFFFFFKFTHSPIFTKYKERYKNKEEKKITWNYTKTLMMTSYVLLKNLDKINPTIQNKIKK